MRPPGSPSAIADAVERLAARPGDSRSLRASVLERLRPALGFDWHVWLLTDPVTGVGMDPLASVPDGARLGDLVRTRYLTAPRWTELAAPASAPRLARAWASYGVAEVVTTVFRDRYGCWGFLDLWRREPFAADATEILAAVSAPLTTALRRSQAESFGGGVVAGEAGGGGGATVVLLDPELTVLGVTTQADAVLRAVLPTDPAADPVPACALNVAAALLAREDGAGDQEPQARLPVPGRGLHTLRAARTDRGDVLVVTAEPATAAERLDLYARSHGLSERERAVVEGLAGGVDTAQLAASMVVSPHTVQDHLKSIFAKTGVRTRRELLARALGT